MHNLRGVMLNGGGLDSLASTAILHSQGNKLHHLFVDYGQRAAKQEYSAVVRMAKHFGHTFIKVKMDLPFLDGPMMRGNAPQKPVEDEEGQLDHSNIIVPVRNVILLSVAASYAETLYADFIAVGFDRTDSSGVCPDTNQRMLDHLVKAFHSASHWLVGGLSGVVAPVAGKSKLEIYNTAKELGANMRDFYSCYVGRVKPCKECTHCVDYAHDLGFAYLDRS